jgi:hypothetical protein
MPIALVVIRLEQQGKISKEDFIVHLGKNFAK